MSLLAKLHDRIQDKIATAPIECPRGWGQVLFPMKVGGFWPFFEVERSCPISGTASCAACTYEPNPDAFQLEEHLTKLDELRRSGALTEEEYATRRAALVNRPGFGPKASHREGYRVTAWVVGPLGTLFASAGVGLALEIHAAFWVMAAVGAVLLALTVTFTALAQRDPDDRDSAWRGG